MPVSPVIGSFSNISPTEYLRKITLSFSANSVDDGIKLNTAPNGRLSKNFFAPSTPLSRVNGDTSFNCSTYLALLPSSAIILSFPPPNLLINATISKPYFNSRSRKV